MSSKCDCFLSLFFFQNSLSNDEEFFLLINFVELIYERMQECIILVINL